MNHEKRILDRTVKAYCRLGNGTLAAKEAGYKKSPSLVNLESQLKKNVLQKSQRIDRKPGTVHTELFSWRLK